jgi:hypothetical protein
MTLNRRQVIRSFLAGLWARATASARRTQKPSGRDAREDTLAEGFASPPHSARPWVYWFWINGNISKEGITADLEALKKAGVGGVLWMEVSGPWWAPDGDVIPLSPDWHEHFQFAVRECQRLGLDFDMTLDFGYGSGGRHIPPDRSMQQIVWTETELDGGRPVDVVLERPKVDKPVTAWLRPGAQIPRQVLDELQHTDSYRDVTIVVIPLSESAEARAYRIADLSAKSGLSDKKSQAAAAPPAGAAVPTEKVVNLSPDMDPEGRLRWDAPPGRWLIIRFGHASNLKMTRPCPAAAVGLECDRLARIGIETHFQAFLRPIIERAGSAAGQTLGYVHIDSWEAGGQNWTATFPAEFRSRRGYDLHPWLPVLTGRVVGSPELSERFLWDVRATASEMIRQNYAGRLRELAQAHGMKLSTEAYGNLCIDDLEYGGNADLPMSEFWARGDGKFPVPGPGAYEPSSKAMASAAHVYGRPVAGAESFTGDRAWRDHPYLLKAMGDKAFCRGINRMVMHLSAHQPRNDMIPGMTHRRWGEHFQRHNTWWSYSQPWIDYLARCQYLLQQGTSVADVCCWVGEGAPLSVNDMNLEMPPGYDFDFCSAENVLAMKVDRGWIVAPSGTRYRYLLLPDTDRFTVPLARKVRDLVAGGAKVIGGRKPTGTPGLSDYPRCDDEVAQIGAALWDSHRVMTGKSLAEVFREDGQKPDFEGEDLLYIHRQVGDAEVYFVSHQGEQPLDRVCSFRVTGKPPELWDPETGAIRPLPEFTMQDGKTSVPLHFEPMQSWFVVFRTGKGDAARAAKSNFTAPRTLRQLEGQWQVTFDPRWGGPDATVRFDQLTDWSRHADPRIHYYSGTAVYRKKFTLSAAEASGSEGGLLVDLSVVEVIARVKLNGKECGIAWKPPYRVDLSAAARAGENELEIEVVNLWINRMIGDEQLPEDSTWKDFETLAAWPEWFKARQPRPSGRYTFTTCKHYTKDSPLVPSGLLGPVVLRRGG